MIRTALVAIATTAVVAVALPDNAVLQAQNCSNASPNAPTGVIATRGSNNSVLVEWSVPTTGCEATRFYVDASHSATDRAIERQTTEDSTVLTVPRISKTWRIGVRAFNESGLSAEAFTSLDEGAPPPVNPCGATLYAPTLISANTSGRILTMQWTPGWVPDTNCLVSSYTIVGQLDPNGPVLGTIDVPLPNVTCGARCAASWTGAVPPGAYYVRVVARYDALTSPASNAILVQVQ